MFLSSPVDFIFLLFLSVTSLHFYIFALVMAAQRHGDTHALVKPTKQNLISPTSQTLPTNTTVMIGEQQHSPPIQTDQFHHRESIWRVVVDIICLLICKEQNKDQQFHGIEFALFLVTTITVISHYVAQPFTRGFFCSDMMIKYPYKSDTIPVYAAVILSIGVPIVWVEEIDSRIWQRHFFMLCSRCGQQNSSNDSTSIIIRNKSFSLN